MRVAQFPPIAAIVNEQTLTVDFGPYLPVGVTLIGTPVVSLKVLNGADSDPQSRIVGGPVIGVAPTPNGSGLANCAVLFQVADCQPGVLYGFVVTCQTSAGDTPEADSSFFCYTPD